MVLAACVGGWEVLLSALPNLPTFTHLYLPPHATLSCFQLTHLKKGMG